MPEKIECQGCEFSRLFSWCGLVRGSTENLGEFCPKEADIKTIKQSCRFYFPSQKPAGGDDMCRAPFHEHGCYRLCWIKNLEDLLRDPDFTLKKSDS